mmetsp:Transcript_50950/g.119411  ORF Transcript_50950/g.119411 Transcript_50950/m.119411 type:complete len:97 (-) Transcript_50950:1392-1682(-)
MNRLASKCELMNAYIDGAIKDSDKELVAFSPAGLERGANRVRHRLAINCNEHAEIGLAGFHGRNTVFDNRSGRGMDQIQPLAGLWRRRDACAKRSR